MSLQPLLDAYSQTPDGLRLQQAAGDDRGILTAVDPARSLLLAALLEARPATRQCLVVAATGRETAQLAGDLRQWLPEAEVLDLPAWETLPHERLSPSAQVVGERIGVLRRVRAAEREASGLQIVVTSARAAISLPDLR